MESSGSRRTQPAAYLFLAPAAACYLAVVVVPILRSMYLSFFRVDLVSAQFVGLDNFARLLADELFWYSLLHNLILMVLSLAIQLPVALFLAALLSGRVIGRTVFRTAYFMPMMLSTVVIGLVWRELFRTDLGLVNSALRTVFGRGAAPDWFGNGALALITVILAISWRYVGFYLVLFVAGIEGIPEELYEAARIDGAGAWASFRHVTLPGLRRVIAIAVLLSVVGSLKYFDLVYIITQGGPGGATELMTTYMYNQAFAVGSFGYASTIAVAGFLVSLAAAGVYMTVLARREREE